MGFVPRILDSWVSCACAAARRTRSGWYSGIEMRAQWLKFLKLFVHAQRLKFCFFVHAHCAGAEFLVYCICTGAQISVFAYTQGQKLWGFLHLGRNYCLRICRGNNSISCTCIVKKTSHRYWRASILLCSGWDETSRVSCTCKGAEILVFAHW